MAQPSARDGRVVTRRARRRQDGPRDAGAGDRCAMCGCLVEVDARGRCRLGHQVLSPDELRDSEPAAEVLAAPHIDAPGPTQSFSTALPSRGPGGGGRADGHEAGEDLVAVYREPDAVVPVVIPAMGPTPLMEDAGPPPTDGIGPLPTRLTQPIPPLQALQIPAEELDDALIATHADNAAAFAAMVEAGLAVEEPGLAVEEHSEDVLPITDDPPVPIPVSAPAQGHATTGEPSVLDDPATVRMARISVTDFTPGAASSLDIGDVPLGDARPERRFEQEPMNDAVDLEPPRTWPQRIAATLFIGVLVAVAWYLATTL